MTTIKTLIAIPRTSLIRNLAPNFAGSLEASLASFIKDGMAKILNIIMKHFFTHKDRSYGNNS